MKELIKGRMVECRGCRNQLEPKNDWQEDPVKYSCADCGWSIEKPNPFRIFSLHNKDPEECECRSTTVQGQEIKRYCNQCSSHGLLKHQSSTIKTECSEEYCRQAVTSIHRCNCNCGGSNHGSDVILRDRRIENLRTGDINLLENSELGEKSSKVVEILEGRELEHQCREDEYSRFTAGVHSLIYGRIVEKGILTEESGISFQIYVICPNCSTSLRFRELLHSLEPEVENQEGDE